LIKIIWLWILHDVGHLLQEDPVLPLDFSVPLFIYLLYRNCSLTLHQRLLFAVTDVHRGERGGLILLADRRLDAPQLLLVDVLLSLLPSSL